MYYILAKEIVDKCLELDLLQEINGSIPIWESASPVDPERYPEGWVLYPKEDVIHMVMDNEEAQKNLQDALLEKRSFDAGTEGVLGENAQILTISLKICRRILATSDVC